MDEEMLWENFKKTGHIADYLRYRGVDIYAATNAVDRKEEQDADRTTTGGVSPDRGTYYSGV